MLVYASPVGPADLADGSGYAVDAKTMVPGSACGSLAGERAVLERLSLGGLTMNPYKLRVIMDFVRRQGKLPTDRWGSVLSPDDLIVWYGLNRLLSPCELTEVRRELAAMVEAEALAEQLGAR